MTKEEREEAIVYLEEIKEYYIEGYGYERHPLPEYYAIEAGIKALSQPQIPDNATNGDVIKAMFSDWKIEHIRKMSGMNRYECNIDTINRISFYDDWWNAPYKREK